MAIDFLHPLCYQKGGVTHKIFGDDEAVSSPEKLKVCKNGTTYLFAVYPSNYSPSEGEGVSRSSIRFRKDTATYAVFSLAGIAHIGITFTTGFLRMYYNFDFILYGRPSKQTISISGHLGSASVSVSTSKEYHLNDYTTSYNTDWALTININGTSYSLSISGSGDYSNNITLTSSVNP